MAQLVFIEENNLLNTPSINLLNQFTMFDEAFTWNVVSGTATASNLIGQQQLQGQGCLRITPTFSVATVVNSGGSQNQITITEDGNYVFSIKHKPQYSSKGATTQIAVKVYINGTPTDYTFFGDYENNDVYKTYFQTIPLLNGDTFDLAFGFGTNDIGGPRKNYFDAFKLEIDSYGLGVPTVFSPPQQRTFTTTNTIDIPSISSNASYTVVTSLTGALITDYVQMIYPEELITLELVVGYPIVSDTDEISFVVHNNTGGSINPASGSYSFKIVR